MSNPDSNYSISIEYTEPDGVVNHRCDIVATIDSPIFKKGALMSSSYGATREDALWWAEDKMYRRLGWR